MILTKIEIYATKGLSARNTIPRAIDPRYYSFVKESGQSPDSFSAGFPSFSDVFFSETDLKGQEDRNGYERKVSYTYQRHWSSVSWTCYHSSWPN